MKRRGVGDGVIPERLLRFDAADWVGEEGGPAAAWTGARRAWVRDHARTLDELNRMYAADVVFPVEVDPRLDDPI